MRCYPEALSALLQKGISSCYLLYGNEPLLIEESAELIRNKIKSDPEVEHLLFNTENANSTILSSLPHLLQERSLFAAKRLIEIRLSSKLTPSDTAYLEKILQAAQEDILLFILNSQLSKQNQQAGWFHLIDQKGVTIAHWPFSLAQFSKWVEKRIKEKSLKMTPEAFHLLIAQTEGNCLAAKQEIDRLSLYYDSENSPQNLVTIEVEQQSQFDVFDLCEAALQAQPQRVIKILNFLKTSGHIASPHLLWVMAQTIRVLLRCLTTHSLEQKQRYLQQAGIRAKSHAIYLKALKMIQLNLITALLARLTIADKQLKSGENSAFWRSLSEIALALTGKFPLPD